MTTYEFVNRKFSPSERVEIPDGAIGVDLHTVSKEGRIIRVEVNFLAPVGGAA